MDKAKSIKEEVLKKEEKVFLNGKNWSRKLTTPVEPKITSFVGRTEGRVKALNKPVPNGMNGELESPERSRDSNGEERAVSPTQIKNTGDFMKIAEKFKD
jgi:hypothetical protein